MLNTERDVKRVKERNRKRGEKGEETCGGNGRRPGGIAAMKRGEILALYGGPECGGSAVYGVWPMEPVYGPGVQAPLGLASPDH